MGLPTDGPPHVLPFLWERAGVPYTGQRNVKGKKMQTIHFNTGRAYTINGQRITATLHPDMVVTFYDHDRMVDGEFAMPAGFTEEDFCRNLVVSFYDRYLARGSDRSGRDGLMSGGVNSVYVG